MRVKCELSEDLDKQSGVTKGVTDCRAVCTTPHRAHKLAITKAATAIKAVVQITRLLLLTYDIIQQSKLKRYETGAMDDLRSQIHKYVRPVTIAGRQLVCLVAEDNRAEDEGW